MNSTYAIHKSDGYKIVKKVDNFLKLLEAELCHDMLPKTLQSVAESGLITITNLDFNGWSKLLQNITVTVGQEMHEQSNRLIDNIPEWKEHLDKMLRFLQIIPNETLHFYDDGVKEEAQTLCDLGDSLIKELIEWLQSNNQSV